MKKYSTAILFLCLLPIIAQAQSNKKSRPLTVRTADAADKLAALDIAVARQIELEIGNGLFTAEVMDTMTEAAKIRYEYSSSISKFSGAMRAYPSGYAATKFTPEFKELRLSIVRILNAESDIVEIGKTAYSPKLYRLIIQSYNARKELACLLLSL